MVSCAFLHTLNTLMHTMFTHPLHGEIKAINTQTVTFVHLESADKSIKSCTFCLLLDCTDFSQIVVMRSLLYCELRRSVETLYSKHDRPVGALRGIMNNRVQESGGEITPPSSKLNVSTETVPHTITVYLKRCFKSPTDIYEIFKCFKTSRVINQDEL